MPINRNVSRKILVALSLSVIVFGSVAVYYGLAFSTESAKVAELQATISRLQNQDALNNYIATIPAQDGGNASISQLNPSGTALPDRHWKI